jgi:hypothetical protein
VQTGEKQMDDVIESICGVSGHTYDEVYDLFFTQQRLVVIGVQSPSDVSPTNSPWAFLISNWFERNKEKKALSQVLKERRQEEKTLTLDELIMTRSQNFAIKYADITTVEITTRFFENKLIFQIKVSSNQSRTISFTLRKEQIPEVRRIINKVLASKLKT